MPDNSKPYGPCPPGYELQKVAGVWMCVKDGAETIKLGTKVNDPVLNPCPPGYQLTNRGGDWVCVLGEEALTLARYRLNRAKKIKGNGITSDPMGSAPAGETGDV